LLIAGGTGLAPILSILRKMRSGGSRPMHLIYGVNTDDDAVEIVAEGNADAVASLERWLAHGPSLARVERVERTELGGVGRYQDFSIAYAAPE